MNENDRIPASTSNTVVEAHGVWSPDEAFVTHRRLLQFSRGATAGPTLLGKAPNAEHKEE
jgi:hypothetical protein